MKTALLSQIIQIEQDVVSSRQRARQVAEFLRFNNQDQTRIATAVSEIARNAFRYAGGGRIEFYLKANPTTLEIKISDKGRGIPHLASVLAEQYKSDTGMGLGIVGARKLMDGFEIESSINGTQVLLSKRVPEAFGGSTPAKIAQLSQLLARVVTASPLDELRQQNRELMEALEALREKNEEIEANRRQLLSLNGELEETNRGVMALYSELDENATSLRKANDIKTRFLANMTHEFRTPLNSMLSLTRMLLDRTDGELTPEQERQVQYIKKSADALYDIVNDLLDIARIEAGKTFLRLETFDMGDVLASLRGMFRPLFANPDVDLIFELGEALPPVYSDEGKVAQILRNFISNSLKFTPEGAVTISYRLLSDGFLKVSVADTGIGIAKENLSRIFEEFVQIESPIQKLKKGTGLGLPLSARLAKLLGGEIVVESELGKGSIFSVLFPLRYERPILPAGLDVTAQADYPSTVSNTLETIESESFKRALQQMKEKTQQEQILIIDDNEIARYLLSHILSEEGYDIAEAATGEAGLQLARQLVPKAIFLDISVPGMNGREVFDNLARDERTKHIPIIVNTSKLLGEKEMKSLTFKAAALILKDLPAKEFTVDKIRQALRKAGLSKRKLSSPILMELS